MKREDRDRLEWSHSKQRWCSCKPEPASFIEGSTLKRSRAEFVLFFCFYYSSETRGTPVIFNVLWFLSFELYYEWLLESVIIGFFLYSRVQHKNNYQKNVLYYYDILVAAGSHRLLL
jgi:hypothetical protein